MNERDRQIKERDDQIKELINERDRQIKAVIEQKDKLPQDLELKNLKLDLKKQNSA